MPHKLVRALLAIMGVGTFAFGLAPAIAPRFFGRLFDLPVSDDPRLMVMVRSVGVRDATIGLGLIAAAWRGGDAGPWLAARIAADTGDTVAVASAVAAGARQPRFVGLGLLAAGAALTGTGLAWLLRAARR